MKVICIENSFEAFKEKSNTKVAFPNDWEVHVGEIYTVLDTVNEQGMSLYVFAEKKWNYRYNTKKFIPLSEIDENEFVREELTEKV